MFQIQLFKSLFQGESKTNKHLTQIDFTRKIQIFRFQVKNCQKFDPEQRGVGFKLGFFWLHCSQFTSFLFVPTVLLRLC